MFVYCGNNPVTRIDDGGEAWWIAACAIVGGIVGGVAKVAANVSTGKDWNEGVIGAVVGGATYGGVLAATGSVAAAGYSSAAAESIINEAISYTPIAKYNGSKQKELTKENIVESCANVVVDTVGNGTVATITGKVASKIVPTNNGWFKPKHFISSFTGKYAIKSGIQTAIQGGVLYGIEFVKHALNIITKKNSP